MDEDVDILTERQRVAEGDADHDTLCLKNLHKTYGSKVNTCENAAISGLPLSPDVLDTLVAAWQQALLPSSRGASADCVP